MEFVEFEEFWDEMGWDEVVEWGVGDDVEE